MTRLDSICVFCGANPGSRPEYAAAATELAKEFGRRHIGLVYGGGSVGMMGHLAMAVRDEGCHIVGVIPESLTTKELMGDKIGELIIVETMHERKAIMASLADGFIALPGGFGTMDELFEIITWGQLGIHQKPIGLLNVAGYFDPLLRLVEHGVDEGFIRPQHRNLFVVESTPAGLLDRMSQHQMPPGLINHVDLDQV
jgi:uncharacterized protein (TIGR00730 family)